ncbi:MAG: DHA2 family efflux MFS transporter permease subunit [Methylomicrobium sp.]
MSLIYSKRLRGWRFVLFNLCLGLGHAVVLFNAGAYIAMLPRVAGGLSIPLSFATWTQTDFMTSLALGFPLGAWLARQQGEYRPFVWAFVLFALASAVCAYSTSLYGYLAARIALGFAGGITLPLGQAMILKEYPDRRKSIGIGVWSLFTLTPFTFGPLIGGWIADHLGWRWLFLFNVPVALAIAGIVGALLYRRGAKTVFSHFDWIGFGLLTVVMGSLQTLLNQGNDWDWTNSAYLNVVMFVCVGALLYWIVWELSVRRPFLDIRLFAHRNFTIGVLMLSIGFLFFQGLLSLLIIQLQLTMGYSSFLAGMVFLPMAIFAKPVASVFHEIVKRCDARPLASMNLLGFAGVYFWLSRFDDPSSFDQLLWPKLIEGICLGSFFAPLTALMLHGLPPAQQPRAVEIAGLMRIAAGAIGISLQTNVIYQRAPFHMTRLAETLTPFDPGYDQVTDTLAGAGLVDASPTLQLAKLARQQAAIHGVNDAFWIAGCVFTAMALLVWLARPTRQPRRVSITQSLRRRALELLARDV